MPNIPGSVPIGGFVAPTDLSDTYATHDSRWSRGGHKEVLTIVERDAITIARRAEGLTCYVKADGQTYQLVGGITNADWTSASSGSGGTFLWEVVTVNFSHFTAAALTESIALTTLVGGYKLKNIITVVDTTFVGPATGAIDIGLIGELNKYTPFDTQDVKVAPNSFYDEEPNIIESITADNVIQITMNATGANVNTFTAGVINLSIFVQKII